jgi:hypothetical protein
LIAQLTAVPRFSRTILAGVLIATTAVFTFGGLPTAAHAVGVTVTDEAGLAAELGISGVDPTVTLGATFSLTDGLDVVRTVTLDLAGNYLFAGNIHLDAGVTLTIVNSIPSSGQLAAYSTTDGLAGITTTGATLIVNSGLVLAGGGPSAVGIGGDTGSGGGAVVIGPAGTVNASGSGSMSAVGAGAGATSFGSLEVNGNFRLQSAELTVPIGASITGTGTITSWNHITNNGTILPTIAGNQDVSGNNFYINLADNHPGDQDYVAYHLYAPTFQAAGIAFPTPDRGPLVSLAGWTSEQDGTGTTLTETTPLSGLSSSVFYAQWTTSGITAISVDYLGSPAPVEAGSTMLTASYSVGAETWNITDFVTFGSNVGADAFDIGYYGAYVETGAVGPRTITGTLTSDATVSDTVHFDVVHSESIGDIALAMTPGTVVAGHSSTAYLSAADAYENAFGYNILLDNPCDWCELTLTSSDPTDVIDLKTGRITFTTPGTHTITAELNMGEGGFLSADATVTVVAAPASLAATGYQPGQAPWAALLLLLLGLVLVMHRRRA